MLRRVLQLTEKAEVRDGEVIWGQNEEYWRAPVETCFAQSWGSQAPRAETPIVVGQRQGSEEKALTSPNKLWNYKSMGWITYPKWNNSWHKRHSQNKNSFMGAWRNQILPSLYLGNREREKAPRLSRSWAYTQNPNREKEEFIFWPLLLLGLRPLQILSSYTPGGEDPVHIRSLWVNRGHMMNGGVVSNIAGHLWEDNQRLASP